MIREIFPSLYVIRSPKAQFTYLLRRPAGNILLATRADLSENWGELTALGPVSHILHGDRHHLCPASEELATKLAVPLSATKSEAAAARTMGVTIGHVLDGGQYHLTDDLEVIPTPGHTPGAVSYLWSKDGRRFLFIGDTLVPINGVWEFWVSRPKRSLMKATIERLRKVEFDVILSNSFACTPTAWFELPSSERESMFDSVLERLS